MKACLAVSLAAGLVLAGCGSSDKFDKSSQYGPDPKLPQPSRGLLPDMEIPKVVGWGDGEKPTVVQGFRIEAMASGL